MLSLPLEELSTEERDARLCRWDVRMLSTLGDGEVGRRIPRIRGRALVLPLGNNVFVSHENGRSPLSARG